MACVAPMNDQLLFKGTTLKGTTFKGTTLKGTTFKGTTLDLESTAFL